MEQVIDYGQSLQLTEEYGRFPLVGMTWHYERAFLHWYAQNLYTGQGEIVDLGSWFGSTVVPEARGLQASSLNEAMKSKRIHAFDRFKWVPSFNESNTVKRVKWVEKYQPGESFLKEFYGIIEKWDSYIEVHPGDLMQTEWSGAPIEFIHVDAMKSWDLANRIEAQFYTHLLPGVSLIAHQDFGHFYNSWIHLQMYRLKDYFHPVYHVPGTCTVIFKYVNAVPEELLRQKVSFSDFTDAQIDEAFSYCRSMVGPEKQSCIASAKAMLYIHAKELLKAGQALRELEEENLPIDPSCPCPGQVREALRVNLDEGYDLNRFIRYGY